MFSIVAVLVIFCLLGVRAEQDLYIRLIDSVTKQVKQFINIICNVLAQS